MSIALDLFIILEPSRRSCCGKGRVSTPCRPRRANAMTRGRRGLLPRQRLRRRRAARAWAVDGEPRRAPTPSGCSPCSTSRRARHLLRARLGGRTGSGASCGHRARGHELASHGYAHRLVYDQTPEAFRDDVRRAKALLEDAGQPVRGYRAPSFSVTRGRCGRSMSWSKKATATTPASSRSVTIATAFRTRPGGRTPSARPEGSLSRCPARPCGSAAPTCRSPAAATSAFCPTPGRDGASRGEPRRAAARDLLPASMGDRSRAAAPARRGWAASATTAIWTRPRRGCVRCRRSFGP